MKRKKAGTKPQTGNGQPRPVGPAEAEAVIEWAVEFLREEADLAEIRNTQVEARDL